MHRKENCFLSRRRLRVIRRFLLLSLVFAGLAMWLFLPQRAEPEPGTADVIVLLAGDNRLRVPVAALLQRQGRAGRVVLTNDGVFSSWSPQYGRNLYQIEWAEEGLVKQGVPRERIVKLPFYGSSTMHDALAVRLYAQRHGVKSLLLVTTDYHAARALWAFRRAFATVPVAIAVAPVKSAYKIRTVGGERSKLLYYQLRYGLLQLMPAMVEQKIPGKVWMP
jgi:uncharacterized SAM-binding protein YcdF (DUF218 family)